MLSGIDYASYSLGGRIYSFFRLALAVKYYGSRRIST
jgi:hypothetical protein